MKNWQIMSKKSLSTFGVFYADTPEQALDQFARKHSWNSRAEQCLDLGIENTFEILDDFRIMI